MHPDKMTYSEFSALSEAHPGGVVLLEGRRSIPPSDAIRATEFARNLATRFGSLRFRSGNAEGSDQAFADGVAAVDPARLQIVAPYASHRKSSRYADATYDSPESLSEVQEVQLVYRTSRASPKNRGLLEKRGRKGPLGAKTAYLIRDTMKVTGHSVAFPRPVCALFYVDLANPMDGGTGHTIRVCMQEGVPYAFQDAWLTWLWE